MNHTPGPWTAIKSPSEEDVWHVKAQPSPAMRGFTKEIAFVDGYENALLIASAPKMHAEIEQLRAALQGIERAVEQHRDASPLARALYAITRAALG